MSVQNQDPATVSTGQESSPYNNDAIIHPEPPATSLCCGGGIAGANISQGSGPPTNPPADPTQPALYTDTDSGTLYYWNVANQAWQ